MRHHEIADFVLGFAEFITLMVLAIILLILSPIWLPFYWLYIGVTSCIK